jgi:hypothetical protein
MKKYTSQLSILVIGFLLATATSYLSAWSGPTSQIVNGVPNGNVPAPINVSNSSQVKQGTLGLGGLSVFGVGQVSTTTYTLPSNLAFGVNGKVGATEYCDKDGQNCSTGPDEKIICSGWNYSTQGGWSGRCFVKDECISITTKATTTRDDFDGCIGVPTTISAEGGAVAFGIVQYDQKALISGTTYQNLNYTDDTCDFGGFHQYRYTGWVGDTVNGGVNPWGASYATYDGLYASAVYFCPRQ